MSTFKHMVSNDTDHVIFNLDELADLHEVDGRQVPVIIDDVKLEEMKANPKICGRVRPCHPPDPGESKGPARQAGGRARLTFDGKTYLVKSVTGRWSAGESRWRQTDEQNTTTCFSNSRN